MKNSVFFKGNPVTLVGRPVGVGKIAPDFRAVLPDLQEFRLNDFEGKVKVLTSFPSLDTPVCDLQVREFNKRAAAFSAGIVVIGLSKDLPFAQRRFCEAHGIKNVILASDYKYSSFGVNYGLLAKELNLLARAVIIVDIQGIVRYVEIVEEMSHSPDYDEAIKHLAAILGQGVSEPAEKGPSRCQACEGGVQLLSRDKMENFLAQGSGWELLGGAKIEKRFKFKDFVEAKYFLDLISVVAEEQGHHPDLAMYYNKLIVTLTTHSVDGLTENDLIMARAIDEMGGFYHP